MKKEPPLNRCIIVSYIFLMCCFSIPGKLVANGEIPERFATFKSETTKPVPETELTVQIVPYVYSNGYNISCYEGRDGSISINVSGGVPPYTFEWSTGESAYGQTTQTIYNLEKNYYNVVVTDSESNRVIKGVTLSQPERHERIFATGTVYTYSNGYNVSCIGCFNGIINIEVEKGSGIYTYQWEDGATTKNRSGLGAGGYSLVIRDGSSCNYDDYVMLSFELKEPPITNWGMQGNFGTNPNTHFLGTKDNTDFVFRTDNIERLRLKSNGNIGIGTINPTEKLTVAGNGKFNDDLFVGKQLSIGGSLKIDSLAGEGFKFDSLSNKSYKLVYVDQEGKLTTKIEYIDIERPPMCLTEYSIPWLLGGNFLPVSDNGYPDYNFIGTCSEDPFRIFTNANERMRITSDGFVGISTYYPRQKLEVRNGSILVSGVNSGVFFHQSLPGQQMVYGDNGNYGIEYLPANTIDDNLGGLNFLRPDGSVGGIKNFVLHLANDGNVGIGTGNPEYKLDVCGTIHAQEIIVDLFGQCPDYVFEPDYNLMSIEDLQEFIARYKHLPEIPSATQVEQEGINLAEMNMLLLKKIEELTLYIIILNERVLELENK